jgi:hypothetical protein
LHTHAHYEQLCALAATGQVPENEAAGFQSHLSECPECCSLLKEFTSVGIDLVAARAQTLGRDRTPQGITERFVARARTEGIAMSPGAFPPVHAPRRNWKLAAMAGLAASLLIAGISLAARMRLLPGHRQGSPSQTVQTPAPFAPAATSPGLPPDARDRIDQLQRQLTSTRAEVNAVTARLKLERNSMEAASRELGSLKASLQDLESEKETFKGHERDHLDKIAKLEGEVEKLNAVKNASDIALMAEEGELRALRHALDEKEAALKREQRMVDAGSQVRDLVVARNLHILDVYDSDGDGNEQRPFGRIFYTEGKSLIFYAYDLTNSRTLDRQVSFYAWGERLGGDQPVKRLGIFHSEDLNQGRWVLTFDDPRVLAQINSVFVTAEKEKNDVTRPKGKRILFAFWGNKANHP